MAVHEDLPGIEVTVSVDGTPLTEYPQPNDQVNHNDPAVSLHLNNWTVTNYIESITGKNFSVNVAAHPEYEANSPTISFETRVDGVRTQEPLMSPSEHKNKTWQHGILGPVSDYYGLTGELRRFQFAEIHTHSDDTKSSKIAEEKRLMSNVGEICIKVYRYSAMEESLTKGIYRAESQLASKYDDKIHEKALKGQAMSHGTSLGRPEPVNPGRTVKCHKLDGEDYPIACFRFKYRSNEALKQLMVIERTPEPEDSLLGDFSAQERREMEDFAIRMRKKRAAGGDFDEPVNLDVDEWDSAASQKRSRRRKPVTIDLTGED